MSGFNNEVMYATGERLQASSAQDISIMQKTPTDVSRINFTGDPNGLVAANPSSLCHDPVSGSLWLKVSGTGTTVWEQIFANPSDSVIKLTENTGTALPDGAGNVNVLGPNSALTGYSPWTVGSGSTATVNMPGTVKWVVNPTSNLGTHTTIQAAITAASSGDDVFITPGTYTENLTLKAGVNLVAYGADSSLNGTGSVIINGTCTFTAAGTVSISGIQLQTNAAALLAVTGSEASIVNLTNCYINCLNNQAITFSSSSASAIININWCSGNVASNTKLFDSSSAGNLFFSHCIFRNSGGATTASTASAGSLGFKWCQIFSPVTTSGTNIIGSIGTNFNTPNVTALTVGGSGANNSSFDYYGSGTATAISVGSSLLLSLATIVSSNSTTIGGAGTLTYSGLSFENSTSNITVTTQVGGLLKGGQFQAPSAGFIGEQIIASVATGAPVALVSATAKTVTSISLTPGIWDVSTICVINGTLQTRFLSGTSLVNNTLGTGGIGVDTFDTGASATAAAGSTGVVPAVRFVLTATTTVYLVASSTFTGSANASGRISGVRVG